MTNASMQIRVDPEFNKPDCYAIFVGDSAISIDRPTKCNSVTVLRWDEADIHIAWEVGCTAKESIIIWAQRMIDSRQNEKYLRG